jgi:hypothetical protein
MQFKCSDYDTTDKYIQLASEDGLPSIKKSNALRVKS